ncbi:hypothetical protein [Roseovarius mucosus]|uniref:hypothetical protein n=1 Tax=Roseovarius mucosus TaxID=215743 RepID=UPI003BAB3840
MLEAKEALRGLIEKIILQPDPNTGRLTVHLQGALAALPSLPLGHKQQNDLSGKAHAIDIVD